MCLCMRVVLAVVEEKRQHLMRVAQSLCQCVLLGPNGKRATAQRRQTLVNLALKLKNSITYENFEPFLAMKVTYMGEFSPAGMSMYIHGNISKEWVTRGKES